MEIPDVERSGSCAGCLNNIGDDNPVSALGQSWHKDCFRCSVCDEALSDWFDEKDGMLFCKNCHGKQVTTAGGPLEPDQPCTQLGRSHLYRSQRGMTGVRASRRARALLGPRSAPSLDKPDNGYQVAGSLGVKVRAAAHRALSFALSLCIQLACFSIEAVRGGLSRNAGGRGRGAGTMLTVEKNCTPTPDSSRKQEETAPVAPLPAPAGSPPGPPASLLVPAVPPPPTVPPVTPAAGPTDEGGKRERLFKRKQGEGGRGAARRRRGAGALCEQERSSSLSQLVDVGPGGGGVLRSRSFRTEPAPAQRVFRAQDLVLGELLGAGFFGSVYLATAAGGEQLVLKQLHRLDEDAQRSFLKEVAVLRSLEHPNVLRFVGVLYKDKRLHLVTEYVAGGTLHSLLQDSSRPLPWRRRSQLSADVACGLRYLHRMSVIHRDLNSHNCLVRQDGGVVVADFGLARVAQRCAGALARNSLRRKRYTVVGNPYWMAPEMMNGAQYDERVDVFSFGIVLCEIIGRVSADPDFLPRRSDFGLNEQLFLEKFCSPPDPGDPAGDPPCCPEALSALAFRCCRLEPDQRPSFERIAPWLSALQSAPPTPPAPRAAPPAPRLLPGGGRPPHTDDKIQQSTPPPPVPPNRALGKCVSASQLAPRRVTITRLSRSHLALSQPTGVSQPGYILQADGQDLNITRVQDVLPWLEPQLKRARPAHQLHLGLDKSRKLDDANLPAFLRNQSVEGLETHCREPASGAFNRQLSEPTRQDDSSDGSDDLPDSPDTWEKHVTIFNNLEPKEEAPEIAKKESKKNSYQVNREDTKKTETKEKTNFFTKRLMSPKLSRLFKQNTQEDEAKSKFFVQHPSSPNFRYKIRPEESATNIIKSDLKLAGMGKPMTPTFRRHMVDHGAAEGRFSYRKPKTEAKFIEIGRNKIKTPAERSFAPLIRSAQMTNIAALTTVLEKEGSKIEKDKRDCSRGISKSNYVSLANLKINGKAVLDKKGKERQAEVVERVI